VSDAALGTVPDDQFVPVFQSPEPGLASHVPLPAKVVLVAESKSNSVTAGRKKARARSRSSAEDASRSGGAMCAFFLRRLKLVFISLVLWLPASAKKLLGVDVGKNAHIMSSLLMWK
jgi:hypothetical protein